MKILNFTQKDIRAVVSLLVMMLAFSVFSLAQDDNCSMICSGDLIAPITDVETCETTVTFSDLLPNPCFGGGYEIKILNLNNQEKASGTNSVTVALVGQYKYKIGHLINGEMQYCWGNIKFEDKKAPIKNIDEHPEPETIVCGSDMPIADPSGYTDLAAEVVSCVVVEEHGVEALEPWFDVLDEDDYSDCTGVDQVFSYTEKFDFCKKNELPTEIRDTLDAINLPGGWKGMTVYKRNWFASDVTGRLSDTCYQILVVVKPRPNRIMIPEEVVVECNDNPELAIQESYPRFRDLKNNNDFLTCPQTANQYVYIEPNSHYCKYAASVDVGERIPVCSDDVSKVFKLVAKWTVIDWCTGQPINDYDQFVNTIEVIDTEIPELVKIGEHSHNTDLFDCTADVIIGAAQFDDCVGELTYQTLVEYVVSGDDPHASFLERIVIDGNGGMLSDVPVGVTLIITYTATDACHNIGEATDTYTPTDRRAPVCIANDEIVVSMIRTDNYDLTKLGARVYGEDIDDTSRDNCYPLIMEVRRADIAESHPDPESLWAEYVEFTEDDLGDDCTGVYKIELRVYEDLGEGEKGLWSTCWGTVFLEDNNPIISEGGEDKEAKCTHPMPEFDEPTFSGCYDGIDMVVDTLLDEPCAYHEIFRIRKTWKPFKYHHDVKTFSGIISQEIAIKNVHDTKFTFPVDQKVNCNDGDDAIPAPAAIEDIIDEEGCANWLMEVSEREFDSNDPDACRKILRTYTFINWCTWNPAYTELAYVKRPGNGLKVEDPIIIHYVDADKDGINDIDDANDGDEYDITTDTTDGAWVTIDNSNGTVPLSMVAQHDQNYVDAYQYGYFAYVQVIKINDDEDPVSADPIVKVTCDPLDTDCEFPRDVTIELGGTDNCSELFFEHYLQPFQEGDLVEDIYGTLDGNMISGRYPVGTHNVVVKTSDACGNTVTDTVEVVVEGECKKPTPVCHAIFTAAMETGSVDIWASDIESGSSEDNCTEYDDLVFSLQLVTDINNNDVIDAADVVGGAPDTDVLTLTCDNIGRSYVALWATDEAGNEQYCLVTVYVTDNTGACGRAEATVTGHVVNENDEDIDQVTVEVSSGEMSTMSDIFDGLFNFQAVPMAEDVTITPKKDLGYLNGVSTSDLVLLQRHILGVNTLNSPYKIIAADANADDKVDTRDMLHISRLILGIYNELPDNSSWRFVASDHTFSNPTQPWGFPEDASMVEVDGQANADFVGIKIGDISGNATPSNLLGDDNDVASRTVALAVNNEVIDAGIPTQIDFRAMDMNQVAGYQFTLELDPSIALDDITFAPESGLTEANFGTTKLDDHLITVSWANVDAVDFDNDQVLFSLEVTAESAINVSNAVQMNSAYTTAEAYDNDVNLLDIQLHILNGDTAFELYQNIPNPVSNETTIGFNLPKAGPATLSIMDVTGKVLRTVEGDYAKGYNEIRLNRSELGSAGVLYYQLNADDNRAAKKMIIID